MRAMGVIGLLLALVIVGLLARKQIGSAAPALPAAAHATNADVRTQSQQIQQQIKQSLDAAQQRRPMPDDD